MGRPPIGGKAMSAAERTRRHRAKLHAGRPPKPTADAAAQAEIAALKVRIAELEAQAGSLPRTVAELAAAKVMAAAANRAKREAAKAARVAQAAQERPALDVPTLLAENLELHDQLKARNTRIRNMRAEVRALAKGKGALTLAKASIRRVRACLHPDRAPDHLKTEYERAAQDFNSLDLDE